MRALYGAVVSGAIGVVVTLATKPNKTDDEIRGLTIWTIRDAERAFKGGEVNRKPGGKVHAKLIALPDPASADDATAAERDTDADADADTSTADADASVRNSDSGKSASGLDDEPPVPEVSLHPDDLAVLQAEPGDLIFIADERWWLGGLRAAHARVGDAEGTKGEVGLPASIIERNSLLLDRGVMIEKLL